MKIDTKAPVSFYTPKMKSMTRVGEKERMTAEGGLKVQLDLNETLMLTQMCAQM